MEDIYPSALVLSTAGRDKGKIFVVLSVEDENYVAICDGRMRKAGHPKRKKVKHLKALGRNDELIRQKLSRHCEVTNAELRSAVKELMTQQRTM